MCAQASSVLCISKNFWRYNNIIHICTYYISLSKKMLTLFFVVSFRKGFPLPLGNYMSARSNSQSREINQKQSSEIFALENVCGEVSLTVPCGAGPGRGWVPCPHQDTESWHSCCLGKQTRINRRGNVTFFKFPLFYKDRFNFKGNLQQMIWLWKTHLLKPREKLGQLKLRFLLVKLRCAVRFQCGAS